MRALPFLLVLAACKAEDDLDLGDPPEELELPDLTGVDLKAAYAAGLTTALQADTRVAWNAHVATVAMAEPGCPDFFAGTPDLEEMDVPEEPAWSWADHCTQPSGRTFGGFAWWQNDLAVTGDVEDAEGATSEAFRRIVADGVVAGADDVVAYEFDGEASDSLMFAEGEGWSQWTYSSLLDGTMTGTIPFDPAAGGIVGGYRAEMYVRSTGGDAQTVEARGNVYWFEHRIAERFDSVAVNLLWGAPDSLAPEECPLEPRGWIGLRTEDAYWFDIVFQPRFDDDPTGDPYQNIEYSPCDGCGTLYVRGLEQTDITVCPDLSFLWNGGLTHPEPNDFALSIRDQLGG